MMLLQLSIFSADQRHWSWVVHNAPDERTAFAGLLDQLPNNSRDFGPLIVVAKTYLH